MGKKFIVFLMFIIIFGSFMVGWISSNFYINVLSSLSINPKTGNESFRNRLVAREQLCRFDWVKQEQIQMFPDKIVIVVDNPRWIIFENTNSMDPVVDVGTHGIEIVPKHPDEIHLGDIISYQLTNTSTPILHRVVEIGVDKVGRYYKTKGDNNPFQDPKKIRFEQISGVLIIIIY